MLLDKDLTGEKLHNLSFAFIIHFDKTFICETIRSLECLLSYTIYIYTIYLYIDIDIFSLTTEVCQEGR